VQPGYTQREGDRFRDLLREAGLVDAYRHFQRLRDEKRERDGPPPVGPREVSDAISTWSAMYDDKAMRIDHFLVSSALLADFHDVEILGRGANAKDPTLLGSDHCPMVLTFRSSAHDTAASQAVASGPSRMSPALRDNHGTHTMSLHACKLHVKSLVCFNSTSLTPLYRDRM
jgi:hypothetical protein